MKEPAERIERNPPLRSRRWLAWTVILPCLTVCVFAGLAALSLLDVKRLVPERGRTVEEVSAQVVARYREEARRLRQIREEARADISADTLLRPFRKDGGGEGAALPPRARLLADLQALLKKAPEQGGVLLRALLPLWDEALGREKTDPRELELLGALALQCALALEEFPAFEGKERERLARVADRLAARGDPSLASAVALLTRTARREDRPALEALSDKVKEPQLRFELERAIDSLGGQERKVADAG